MVETLVYIASGCLLAGVTITSLWVPETGSVMPPVGFMYESAEAYSANDGCFGVRSGSRCLGLRWTLSEGSVRTMPVVMGSVFDQDSFEVSVTEDE